MGTESLRGAQLAAIFLNGEEGEVSLAGIGPDGLARLGSPKVPSSRATPAATPPAGPARPAAWSPPSGWSGWWAPTTPT